MANGKWKSAQMRRLAQDTFASICHAFPGLHGANARRLGGCGFARGQRVAAAKWFRSSFGHPALGTRN